MATLTFTNVEFLQYSENMDFLDTAGFRLTSRREMTIKGELLALYNSDGTNAVLSQVSTLRASLNQYYPEVMINGKGFGAGEMISININSNDNYVRSAFYTAKIHTLIRYPELSQEQFGGTTDFAGLSFLFTEQLPARIVRAFKEEYNYERNNDIFSYTHSINVSLQQVSDGLQRVVAFANQLFALTNPIGCLTTTAQQLDNASLKPSYVEKFDLLNNTFSFTKRLHATNPDFTNNIENDQAINFTMAENGLVTVTETAKIKSLTFNQPNLLNITGGTLGRITGIFAAYNDESFSLYPLNTGNPIVNIFGYDAPNRTTSYQISYNNDPRYFSTYNWDYSVEVVKNGAYLSATEKGKIVGIGNNSATMFNNALVAYPSIYNGILPRLSSLLLNYYPTVISLVKHQYKGIIEYAQTYTENPIYADQNVISVEINVNDKFKVPVFNNFNVFNYGVLSQPLLDSTTNSIQGNKIGERSITIDLQGRKISTEATLKNTAQNYANLYIPSGYTDVFLTDCKYIYEPIEKKFDLNCTWNYD